MADIVKVDVDYKVAEGTLDSVDSQELMNVLSDAIKDALNAVAGKYNISYGELSITSLVSKGIRNIGGVMDGAERKCLEEKTNIVNYGTVFPSSTSSHIVSEHFTHIKGGHLHGH